MLFGIEELVIIWERSRIINSWDSVDSVVLREIEFEHPLEYLGIMKDISIL